MGRFTIITILFLMLVGVAAGQVVISDDPNYSPPVSNYIFDVHSNGTDQFRINNEGGAWINGLLEVDSMKVNGLLNITSGGESFFFLPNRIFPPPTHDLLRVSTRYFTVMGGGQFNSQPLLGMGVNTETPNDMLDVNGGDIDVNPVARGYQIGDQYVLRHKGLTDNIFVGVDAGLSLTGGTHLTFVGNGAGQNVINAGNYTFVGYRAGYQNSGGSTNTFIGSMAGYAEMGDENVFVGWMTGHNTGQASYHNTFVGNICGFNNQNGMNNTFIGIGSGNNNISGSDHVALGASAGPGPGKSSLLNTIAIGVGTQVMNSNQMILGDNTINVGIGLNADPSGPQNKLEIDAGINGMNPTIAGNLGASGLRLRDLHDLTLPSSNSRNVFLSVDGNGDVILVSGPSSSSGAGDNGLSTSGPTATLLHLGQSIGASGNPAQLLDNREIPMHSFNLYFNGDFGPNQDMVEIGDNTVLPLTPVTGTKLNVQTQTEQSAGLFVNRTNLASSMVTYGLQGLKLMGTNPENTGVHGYAELDPLATPGPLGLIAIGVKGDAVAQSLPGFAGVAFGVWGEAVDNQTAVNYGGFFRAANALGWNYAVYGDALGIGGTPGPGTPAGPTYAGFFNGDVYITNTYGPSDRKLKKDIRDLDNALDIVMQLSPKTYEYRRDEFPGMALPSGKQYGLIAQDVEQVLPEIVMDNVNPQKLDAKGNVIAQQVDFKSLSYQELVPVLIKAIQEQQEQIERQEAEIQALRQSLKD
jgi:hypothetical protein